MTDEELQDAVLKECEDETPIRFSMDRLSMMTIVGALQLALRHPTFAGMNAAAPMVRTFIEEIERRAPPALRELIARGANPAEDRCQHGVKAGEWCGPCNAEYKRARREQP